jgi:hypothetical protein
MFETGVAIHPPSSKGPVGARRAAKRKGGPRRAAKRQGGAQRLFWRIRRSPTTADIVVWTTKITIHVVGFVAVAVLLAVALASAGFVVCDVARGKSVVGPCPAVPPPSDDMIRSAYTWLITAGALAGAIAYCWHWVAASSSYQDRPWRLSERFGRIGRQAPPAAPVVARAKAQPPTGSD